MMPQNVVPALGVDRRNTSISILQNKISILRAVINWWESLRIDWYTSSDLRSAGWLYILHENV